MNWLGFVREFEAQQESATANGDDSFHFLQTFPQITFNRSHIRQHPVVLYCLQGRRYCRHRYHAAAEGCAQIILLDM